MRRNRQQQGTASSSKRSNAGDQRQSLQLRQAISGMIFSPSEMPPSYCGQPYASITLIIRDNTKNFVLNVASIRRNLCYQAGFADKDVHFDFRLQSIAAWGMGATTLTCFPKDYIHGKDGAVEITRIDSNGMKNMYPRIGFRYPIAHQSLNLSTSRDTGQKETQLCEFITDSGSLEVHAKILWRGADSRAPVLQFGYETPKVRRRDRLDELQTQLDLLKLSVSDTEVSEFEEPFPDI